MSHEGLQLAYEEALTREVAAPGVPGMAPPHVVVPVPVHPPAAHYHVHWQGSGSGSASSAPRASPPGDRVASVPSSPVLGSSVASPSAAAAAAPSYSLHYNLGSHFLWIGDRTRQLDHAHVEYFRGIANPIGVKIGPSTDPAELVELVRTLWPNPAAWPGKIVLITRMGAAAVKDALPPLIRAVAEARFARPVIWTCDPMHGNTRITASGLKTRNYDDILQELTATFECHRACGSRLGGVHFELTGENVTECVGGPEKLLEHDLPRRYTTYCDPRLNYAQGMELAFLIAQYLADERERDLVRETGIDSGAFVGAMDEAVGFSL
jgi:3-deoxy-D-arabino-heptulosonate 7-phosphate (DAHP) synthase class II